MHPVSDLHVAANIPLPSPMALREQIPQSEKQADCLAEWRDTIHRIFSGKDGRFLLVVGPCSIHDRESALEYARNLADLARRVQDRIFIVMRVYFEKPRTAVGWKGLIMDPRLDGSNDITKGLCLARSLLCEVAELGLPAATELLDPITPQYIADLIAWSAIGARTTESQTHRQMASGLSMPLGFKNSTPGTIEPAINGIKAALQPQTFLGVSPSGVASVVTTRGNPDCHLVLRGGDHGPNYDPASVAHALSLLQKHGLPPFLMIDASHANCHKDHAEMPAVFRDILRQRVAGNRGIAGAMLESHLLAGNQPFPRPAGDLVYGQSITDPCIDWATTETLVLEAWEALGADHSGMTGSPGL